MRLVAGVLCLLTVSFLSGCGGKEGSLVEGSVMYSGGSPLETGVVALTGKGGSYRAKIEKGLYKIENVPDGTYKVSITGAKEGGSDEGDGMNYDKDGNFIEEKPGAEPKSLIDAKYTDPELSGLTITVPGKYDLEVVKAQ